MIQEIKNAGDLSLRRLRPHFLIFLVVAGAFHFGLLEGLENALMDSRFRLDTRPASEKLILVEIDASSLQQLDQWPWPRRYHARVLDNLIADGARTVAFDIDFSARSFEQDDDIFAAAMQRADGKVVLPVFEQHATSRRHQEETVVNAPITKFRENARLASVTVFPEPNGQVRRISQSEILGGKSFPTLPSVLSGKRLGSSGRYAIDFGIDPATIPRISYADVMAGDFAAGLFRDKLVIVGAVALELGEQISAPLYPVLSGPELQALAYESLEQGRAFHQIDWPIVVVVTALITILGGAAISTLDWRYGGAAVVLAVIGIYGIGFVAHTTAAVVVEVSPWMLSLIGCFAFGVAVEVEQMSRAAFRRRMEAEDQRSRLVAAMEDSPDGVVILGWDDSIRLINDKAAKVFQTSREDANARQIDEFLRPLDFGGVWFQGEPSAEFIRRIALSDDPVEFSYRESANSYRTIEMSIRRSLQKRSENRFERREADREFYSLTLRDVTQRRALENTQREAAQAAIEANEAKTLFLANMSHELRTPLNAILGFTEMMRNGVLGPMRPAKYLDYINDIHVSGQHLLALLSDILDLSKVEAGEQRVDARIVGIREIFTECLTIAEGRMAKLDRMVTVDVDANAAYVWADRRLLLQSILNLLVNAIKYSDSGTQIWLRSFQEDSSTIVIEVEDLGWGISEEDLKSVALPFYQAGEDKRRQSGIGLGLSLVAQYTELHGGRFEIQSQLGQGTIARILLPSMVVQGGRTGADESRLLS